MARPQLRLHVVQAAFGVALLVLLARAGQVQLLQGSRHAATARSQRTERVELAARRGTLNDRNGTPLALTQRVYRVGVAPNELADTNHAARLLSEELGVPRAVVRRELAEPWAYFHGPFTAVQVQLLLHVRGVYPEAELVRFYPDPDLARAVIGRPAAEGRPASGLERILDSVLEGTAGSAVILRDRLGNMIESPSGLGAFPVAGHDVELTIDAELQEIVEGALAEGVEQYDAAGGDVVVLNPRTGEVLAVASVDASGRSAASVFTSVFEPGSTAKLFAAAALLDHGLVEPSDSVWAEQGEYRVGNRTIRDEHPNGWITLTEAIEQSSNIGIAKFSLRLTPEWQFDQLRGFGLGSPTGVEFPAESPGILKAPHQWSGTTPASLAMGYEVAVTAIQLAQAYGAIANDGVMLQPALVREVRAADERIIYRHAPIPVRRVVSAQVAADLRSMLHGVVYRGGTGETAALTSYELAGKTGTARRAGPGGYIPNSYTASFASLFPADDPQLVMVVKLDDPKGVYARVTAAPITRNVVERLLAAQSAALDRTRLTRPRAPASTDAAIAAGTVPYVVEWPAIERADSAVLRSVPDVTGRSLRDAARVLHQAGLRVRVDGWGVVHSLDPEPGASVAPGTVVTVRAAERRPR